MCLTFTDYCTLSVLVRGFMSMIVKENHELWTDLSEKHLCTNHFEIQFSVK